MPLSSKRNAADKKSAYLSEKRFQERDSEMEYLKPEIKEIPNSLLWGLKPDTLANKQYLKHLDSRLLNIFTLQ